MFKDFLVYKGGVYEIVEGSSKYLINKLDSNMVMQSKLLVGVNKMEQIIGSLKIHGETLGV